MRRIKNHKRNRKIKKLVGLFFGTVLLCVCVHAVWKNRTMPVVTLEILDETIYQDEDVPMFSVQASTDKDAEKIMLERSKKYTVKDLLNDFNSGKGYQLKYQVDVAKEGTYSIKLEMDKTLQEKFLTKWGRKIQYVIEDGTLEVKNKLGVWEGEKFKKFDNTYAKNEFIISKGDTYYFDKNGKMVVGKQEILGVTYYFKSDGKFDTTKNKVNPAYPMVALTFDDGPGKYTDKLLEALEEYNARATFFMLGQNVSKYPESIQKMKELGCELGNHTMDHKNLTKIELEEMELQIEGTNDLLKEIVGEGATLVRPPYGAVNSKVRENLQYPVIMWSIDTLDWEKKDAKAIADYTLEMVKDGDIILMHDIYEQTVDATIVMISKLTEQGYQLVTVSEMALTRGSVLENGVKYFGETIKY